jgi:16S rRNA G966 N2-methylase RsmD
LITAGLISHLSRTLGRPAHDLIPALCAVLGDPPGCNFLCNALADLRAHPVAPDEVARLLRDDLRRAQGIYPTPDLVAASLVSLAPAALVPGPLLDLSAGAGALLIAALARWPDRRVVAVEQHPTLAIACAVALLIARGGEPSQDRVLCGDGLSAEVASLVGERGAALVVANPPYLGEKGRAPLFASLRAAHPHLAPYWGPRQDLLYLFLHRGLDLLAPGGHMAALTSAYWLQATGARLLRRDLTARAHVAALALIERRLFEDAPGHHSLLSLVCRHEDAARPTPPPTAFAALDALPEQGWSAAWSAEVALPDDGAPWTLREAAVDVSGWTPLAALVRDCQGFVSGLDRVTARHVRELEALGVAAPPVGAPGFMFRADEVPDALWRHARPWLLPLLRAHMIVPGSELVEPSWEEVALFVDGEIDDPEARAAIEAQLAPLRPLLERRREVAHGRFGWTRLHWPRRLADQRGPKLVCPRRAAQASFMLDLSGSVVSSDCTYLLAPPHVPDPADHLRRVMAALQSEALDEVLQAGGKRKGAMLEFYAEPLRALRIPW